MPWKISYLEDLKIIKTVYTEPAKLEELTKAVLANVAIAKEKGTNLFLGDCTALTETGSAVDIYQLGKFLESLNVGLDLKEAIVAPKTEETVIADLHFYETVTNNRKIKVRLFQDIQEATEWLLSEG
jgi:hypothetical protein